MIILTEQPGSSRFKAVEAAVAAGATTLSSLLSFTTTTSLYSYALWNL